MGFGNAKKTTASIISMLDRTFLNSATKDDGAARFKIIKTTGGRIMGWAEAGYIFAQIKSHIKSLAKGTAAAGNVLSGKTFNSGTEGVMATGTMANNGAWTGATTGSGNVTIPAGYHNGSGYVSGAGAYNAGVSATKKGTASAADVLKGKTFTNSSSVGATGTMENKAGSTVTTTNTTEDDDYTYFGIPVDGYYNTNSKVGALTDSINGRKREVLAENSYMTTDDYSLSVSYTNDTGKVRTVCAISCGGTTAAAQTEPSATASVTGTYTLDRNYSKKGSNYAFMSRVYTLDPGAELVVSIGAWTSARNFGYVAIIG